MDKAKLFLLLHRLGKKSYKTGKVDVSQLLARHGQIQISHYYCFQCVLGFV